MANRTYNQTALEQFKKVCRLYPVISVAAAGAVTLKRRQFRALGTVNSANSTLVDAATSGSDGAIGDGWVRTVTRSGAGAWTVKLLDNYQWLIGVSVVQVKNANGLITSGFGVGIVSGSLSMSASGGSSIAIVLNNGSGAATDPANGDEVTLQIVLGDVTEP